LPLCQVHWSITAKVAQNLTQERLHGKMNRSLRRRVPVRVVDLVHLCLFLRILAWIRSDQNGLCTFQTRQMRILPAERLSALCRSKHCTGDSQERGGFPRRLSTGLRPNLVAPPRLARQGIPLSSRLVLCPLLIACASGGAAAFLGATAFLGAASSFFLGPTLDSHLIRSIELRRLST
jgi:hypothetical protein